MTDSSTKAQPAATPEILYKYMPVERAIEMMRQGTIRWTSPLTFNDPFDGQFDWSWQLKKQGRWGKTLRMYFDALLMKRDIPMEWPPEIRKAIEESRNNIQPLTGESRSATLFQELDRIRREADLQNRQSDLEIKRSARRIRSLCLSEHPDSIQVWSYYGDQHRGVSVGFDVQAISASLKTDFPAFSLEKVDYPEDDDLPEVLAWDKIPEDPSALVPSDGLHPNVMKHVLARKHKGWAHEAEWRFLFQAAKQDHGDYSERKLPAKSVRRIVLGCRTDPVKGDHLYALSHPHAHEDFIAVKLCMHPFKFALCTEEERERLLAEAEHVDLSGLL